MKKHLTLFALLILWISNTAFLTDSNTFILDKGHTHIGFDVERFWVGEVTGRFNDFDAKLSMDGDDLTSLQIDATIKVNSLDSNNETRDGHLKGKLWLDEANHPEIRFISTQISKHDEGYIIQGDFTIKGKTRSIKFPVEFMGPFKDPTQKTALGIKADFTINRFDYGIVFDKKMDNGRFFIGEEVQIKIRALAYKE